MKKQSSRNNTKSKKNSKCKSVNTKNTNSKKSSNKNKKRKPLKGSVISMTAFFANVPSLTFPDVRVFHIDVKQCVNAKKDQKRNSSKKTEGDFTYMAYCFEGFPDEEQEAFMKSTIGGCRFLWNRMKADRDEFYQQMGTKLQNTPADYKDIEGLEWLNDLDSLALANVQLNHESAYSDFLSGKKGCPKFKKKGIAKESYTTNLVIDKNGNHNITFNNGMLKLPKMKNPIKLRQHRTIIKGGTLKKVTVTHLPTGKWNFSLTYQYQAEEKTISDKIEEFIKTGDENLIKHIGLDMSLPNLFVDSNNCLPSYIVNDVVVSFRKCYLALEDKIVREQRKLSHMVKDSNNYKKQCKKIAKLYTKAKQQRNDFLHQIAVRLAREYDVISIEDLDIAALKQTLHFGKSISDNGWGIFVSILEQKCLENDCLLIRVDKWFPSSKTCCHCGHIHNELKLKDRTYICPKCGHVMDRDYQAAVNIDREGLRILIDTYRDRKGKIKPIKFDEHLVHLANKTTGGTPGVA